MQNAKTLSELKNETMRLNPNSQDHVKAAFDAYIQKSLPPTPGFFENGDIEFPLGSEYNKAYKTINSATYRFHHLDRETLLYANQENHFKYHGFYEQIFEDVY